MTYDPESTTGVAARPPGVTVPYIQLPFDPSSDRAPRIYWGTGTPESNVTGRIGDLFLRTDADAGGQWYQKATGDDTKTGWVQGPTVGLFSDGAVASPSISFSADQDTGFYRAGANIVGVAAGGSNPILFYSDHTRCTLSFRLIDGTADSPGLQFQSDQDTGFYRYGANQIGVSVGGVAAIIVSSSGVQLSTDLLMHNGSAADPSISFAANVDTGLFRQGTNAIGVTCGGTERLRFTTAGLLITTIGELSADVGVTIDSVLLKDAGAQVGNGSAGAPTITFASDTDTGLYRVGANSLGISAGGTARLQISSNVTIPSGTNLVFGGNDQKITFGGLDCILHDNTNTVLALNMSGASAVQADIRIDGGATGGAGHSDILIGASSLIATNATGGFLCIPGCNGAPSGTPANGGAGPFPMVYDSSNRRIYIYDGSWGYAALT